MPQSIFQSTTYIGDKVRTPKWDEYTWPTDYDGQVPKVADASTYVPTSNAEEVVFSETTSTVWTRIEGATAIPYFEDSGKIPSDTIIPWYKANVWNWVRNSWWLLNADHVPMDYVIQDITDTSAKIVLQDNEEFETFPLVVSIQGGAEILNTTLPDGTLEYTLTGLTPTTTYDVDLRANLRYGDDVTEQNIVSFSTSQSLTPPAPINLRATAVSNTQITLAWDDSPTTSAVQYEVYQGYYGGSTRLVHKTAGTTQVVKTPVEDRKYRYYVRGVNISGRQGPRSNELRYATGHAKVVRSGSSKNVRFNPEEVGSWRPDIQWRWARPWGIASRNPLVYQGYWPGLNWVGPSNPYADQTAATKRRYRGAITYDGAEMRNWLDRKYGAGVGDHVKVNKCSIRKVYRHRNPGYYESNYLLWHLTYTNPFTWTAAPPIYGSHRNNRNNADQVRAQDGLKAGHYHEFLRLPRAFGKALIAGKYNGSKVNGLLLYRGDHFNNGYGAAGYGAMAGHLRRDHDYPNDAWRQSNWTLFLDLSWSFTVRDYKAPYRW